MRPESNVIDAKEIDRVQARGNLYALLSLCFLEKASATVRDWVSGDLAAAFQESLDLLPSSVESGAALGRLEREAQARGESHLDEIRRELELERQRLFVGPAKLPCPPYESVYRTDVPAEERGLLMGEAAADVRRRYREVGLDLAPDQHDLPDHISSELEFMHFLCRREVEALERNDEDEAAAWHARQRSFVHDHLAVWVPRFCADVVQATNEPFYAAVAALCQEHVLAETRAMGEGDTAS